MVHSTCAIQTWSQTIRPSSYLLVFSNAEYSFVKNKYEDTSKHLFGVDFTNADVQKIAEAQGAVGFWLTVSKTLMQSLQKLLIEQEEDETVIDARITQVPSASSRSAE